MKSFFGLLLGLLVLTAESRADRLTLYTEENPPLNFTDKATGEVTGAATELVTAILDKAGVEFTVRSMPWARSFRAARENPNACVFAAVRSKEREDSFEWVSPLFVGGWALYRKPGSNIAVSDVTDMEGLIVAAMVGTAAVSSLKTSTNAEVVTASRDDVALTLLYHGRADLWLSGVFAAPHSAQKAGQPMPELAFIWRPSVLALACGKGTDPELIARLNKINGELDDFREDLMRRYHYGDDGTHLIPKK